MLLLVLRLTFGLLMLSAAAILLAELYVLSLGWFLCLIADKLRTDGSQKSHNIVRQPLKRRLALAARSLELMPLRLLPFVDRSGAVEGDESAGGEFLVPLPYAVTTSLLIS